MENKIRKKALLLLLSLAINIQTNAQDQPGINVSAYLEIYYGYDLNKPEDNNRPSFIYSHNRHNELNLNLGFIKGNYDNGKLRANMALMTGTYANANLSSEPGVLKNIYEANIGLKLCESSNIWLDAGILGSHIGFESAISKDNWALTRNISSDNSPYYEAGLKITYISANDKITISGLFLNGWQSITRQNGNSKPAAGLQMIFKPVNGITLNYSNYLGTEGEDSVGVRRFYNNFYSIIPLTNRLGLILGFDYATQQKSKGAKYKNKILSPVVIARYRLDQSWAIAGRVEYYEDKNEMLIKTGTLYGFRTKGYSLNIDYIPFSNAIIRLEGKSFDSNNEIFIKQSDLVKYNTSLTASIALSF